MDFPAIDVELSVNEAKREVTAYAAWFGNRDLQGMRTMEGCFSKSLSDQVPLIPSGQCQIKFFRNHEDLVGVPRHIEQDTRGLLTVSYFSETEKGNDSFTLALDGALNKFSYRAGIVRAGMAIDGQDADGNDIETIELRELQLKEYGPVDLLPANPMASVIAVKGAYSETLEAIREMPWIVKSLAISRKRLTAAERRIATDLLKLYDELGGSCGALKALLAPDSVTSPTAATPTLSTPADAEKSLDLSALLESLRRRGRAA